MDSEARWVRKGRHYRYGYKKHVLTDEQGLVETVVTTSANCADTVVLPELIKKSKLPGGISVLADKGYCSKKNSEYLARQGLIDETFARRLVCILFVNSLYNRELFCIFEY